MWILKTIIYSTTLLLGSFAWSYECGQWEKRLLNPDVIVHAREDFNRKLQFSTSPQTSAVEVCTDGNVQHNGQFYLKVRSRIGPNFIQGLVENRPENFSRLNPPIPAHTQQPATNPVCQTADRTTTLQKFSPVYKAPLSGETNSRFNNLDFQFEVSYFSGDPIHNNGFLAACIQGQLTFVHRDRLSSFSGGDQQTEAQNRVCLSGECRDIEGFETHVQEILDQVAKLPSNTEPELELLNTLESAAQEAYQKMPERFKDSANEKLHSTAINIARTFGGSIGAPHPLNRCLSGVQLTLKAAGLLQFEERWGAPNYMLQNKTLERYGYTNMVNKISVDPPPPGAILLYEDVTEDKNSRQHGHAEIYTGSVYCSDFCRSYKINDVNSERVLKGVYLKVKE